MALLDLLRTGVLSGIPVAIAIGLLFILRSGTSPILKDLKFPRRKGKAWALLLGPGLAVVLSGLAFLPIYQGTRMTGAVDVSILNLIVGVGFGFLIPFVAV